MRVTQMRQLIAAAEQAGNADIVASVQALMQARYDVIAQCREAGGLLADLVSGDLAVKAEARGHVKADVQAKLAAKRQEAKERKQAEKKAAEASNPPITRHARKQAAAPKVAQAKGKGAALPVRQPAASKQVPATPASAAQATSKQPAKPSKQAKSA